MKQNMIVKQWTQRANFPKWTLTLTMQLRKYAGIGFLVEHSFPQSGNTTNIERYHTTVVRIYTSELNIFSIEGKQWAMTKPLKLVESPHYSCFLLHWEEILICRPLDGLYSGLWSLKHCIIARNAIWLRFKYWI